MFIPANALAWPSREWEIAKRLTHYTVVRAPLGRGGGGPQVISEISLKFLDLLYR